MNIFKRILPLGALALASLTAIPTAAAQTEYPNKPVRLIVAYAAGGAADVLGRIVGNILGERLGTTVVVENMPGAGGLIGTRACANAAPDGYTLCMGSPSNVLLAPLLTAKPPYTEKDLSKITMVAAIPNVLVVSPKLGINNIDELMQHIRDNPGIGWGTSGTGTTNHLVAVYLNHEHDLSIEHIPYKGGVLAVQDVLAGHLPIAYDQLSSSLAHIRANTLVPIVQQGSSRSSMLPSVPTFAETVLPEFDQDSFQGLFAPAGVPAELTTKIADALRAGLDTETRDRLEQMGMTAVINTPQEFAAQIEAGGPVYRKLIEAAGLQPQ